MPPPDHTDLVDRRSFLKSAGAAFITGLSAQKVHAAVSTDAIFASAYRSPDGDYGVATLAEHGEIIHRYALPDRGHDVVWNPMRHQMVAFARRPGTYAAIIDPAHENPPQIISAAKGRHFYGHGVFSSDGQSLFATENDFENARGVVGIYAAADHFERIGEFDAYGVGPHDMELLPDNRTLVIANGGIETHPDFPRAKLNISTMRPNIVFVDAGSGALKASFELDESHHKLSIRHLAILRDTVWFACQNEGDLTAEKPLVGSVSMSNGDLQMLELPHEMNASLRGYVGSIAASGVNGEIAFTSPRGGVAIRVDARSGVLTKITERVEVCGIAAKANGFALTSGDGRFEENRTPELWDNHLLAMRSI